MAHPETEKKIVGDHFDMLLNPDESGLSPAQQATLAERYRQEDWQDPDIEAFYDDVFVQLAEHPGEFVAKVVWYEHGVAIEPLLPDEAKPFGFPNEIGSVAFRHRDFADISDRIPGWKHFPHGFEGFCRSDDDPEANPETRDSDIKYRNPSIELSDIRQNTGIGQVGPIASRIVIGNNTVQDMISSLLEDETISRRQAISIQAAFMLLSEALDVEVPILSELESDFRTLQETYASRVEKFRKIANLDRLHIAQTIALMGKVQSDRMELSTGERPMSFKGLPASMTFRDRRNWPYQEIGSSDWIKDAVGGILSPLQREVKEIEGNQLPFAQLYLASVQRYLAQTYK